jgi:glycosyltransferase involved in cell wall biosynthesis
MAHILIISYKPYAHDARLKRQAEALACRGDQVDVICLSSGMALNTNGVTILELAVPRYRGSSRRRYLESYIAFMIRAALLAIRRSFTASYDLVVVCSMPDALVISALPCRFFGSKILLDVQDTMPELYLDKFGGRRGRLGARILALEERLSARLADGVLAVHDPHAERLLQAGIPASKIVVVTNLPDPRIFKLPGADQLDKSPDGSHFTVVFHGTVTPRLGLDTAVKAVAMLHNRLPDLRLRIIGWGDHLDAIKALSHQLGIASAVSFESPVGVEELPATLAGSTVGLVPNHATRSTQLMLPVKLLEYTALGIPVIAARLRTIEHYFSEDAVRYFTPGDSSELAEAIEELYFDRARRRALWQRASEMATKLDWRVQYQHFYSAVDALLQDRKVPRRARSPGYSSEERGRSRIGPVGATNTTIQSLFRCWPFSAERPLEQSSVDKVADERQ